MDLGSSIVREVEKVLIYSRPNGYLSSTTTSTPASSASTAQTSSTTNNWGMSSVYQNIRLRTPHLFYLSNPIAVYKRLPFYTPLTNVTQAYTVNGTLLPLFCSISLTSPACSTSRIAQPIHLRLTTEMLSKLQPKQSSNPYRLVLFSTQTDRVPFGNCVIEFPAHTDIRCNGSPVQANVRGIKNRPGTINPPDVTAQIIMMQGVQNKIDVTFSDSKSSYTLTVYLVEKHTVAQLVEKIRKRGFISKDATLSKSMFPLPDRVLMDQ